MPFDSKDSNVWEGSSLQTALNGVWLENHPTLKAMATPLTFKTRAAGGKNAEFIESHDKVFCLSEADMNGTYNGGLESTPDPQDYTLGQAGIIVPQNLKPFTTKSSRGCVWTRSPNNREYQGINYFVTRSACDTQEAWRIILDTFPASNTIDVRPAVWVDLNKENTPSA